MFTYLKNSADNNYTLIKEIERRFTEGFYEKELLSFDPKRDFLKPETNASCILKVMQEKTIGTLFERIEMLNPLF